MAIDLGKVKGEDGKSAYESAKSGGFQGTESSFNSALASVPNLQTQINGKAPSNHTHDDRYYTEAEINNKLGTQVIFSLSGTTLTITTK